MIGTLADDHPKTFVFDLDGVVYVDRAGVPGAGEALTALRRAGHQVLFATNNSSRSVGTVVDNIRKRTDRTPEPGDGESCGTACHNSYQGPVDFFLRAADLDGVSDAEKRANENVIVPDGSPFSW